MPHRIEIVTTVNDTKSSVLEQKLRNLGYKINGVKSVEVYTINKSFNEGELKKIAAVLSNSISQKYYIDDLINDIPFSFALEIGFLAGVTDNIGTTARENIEDLFKTKFTTEEGIYRSDLLFIDGELTENNVKDIAEQLSNNLIQRASIKDHAKFMADKGMDTVVPKVVLTAEPKVDTVDLNIPEEELILLGKEGIKDADGTRRGPLALELDYLNAIKDYFSTQEGRNPTDIELEALAQTWSEHCKHTIFAAEIDEKKGGLFKDYIRKATTEIRKEKGDKDICVSVFSDNAGGIVFDENWVITDKAETHNSPSALDPFGGAITGIVGVNRDTIGFGKGAKPVINKYGFCVGNPSDQEPLYRDKELKTPTLPPKRILDGVVEGVNAGGNCSGIPTPQGFVYFHDSYKGKPLIFVGTVGLIPKEIDGQPSWEKSAQPGDKIVLIGGRAGQDGIHGATFSSEELTAGSPATAVQIGDPITQKKLSDALIKEARDQNLYNSITDNGAGGISCSVAEMAKECGGFIVDLEKVPLKYANLEPWKIWVNESQERMTLAIPQEKLEAFTNLMEKRGVETTVIGEFTAETRCVVRYNGKAIMDMEMDFLHEGIPKKHLKTVYEKTTHDEPEIANSTNWNSELKSMLSRPNICSFEHISKQYDHEVQAGSVLKPLQGKGKVNSTTSVTRPVLESKKGVICSQGLNPIYSEIDTYHMAASAIDTAVRNVIAAGGTLEHLAIMDNFCWCSSNDPQRLGELKAAAEACFDYAKIYGTPYISGKDSMFNDFRGFDKDGEAIKISALPTLLISSLGVIEDAAKSVSLEPKLAGDLVYVIGETKDEMGGSEYFALNNAIGNSVPKVDGEKAKNLYNTFTKATAQNLIASSVSPSIGGLAVTLAKMAIAADLGMELNIDNLATSKPIERTDHILFSESQSRFIVTIDPQKKEAFESLFSGFPLSLIGKVSADKNLIITRNGEEVVHLSIPELNTNYRKTFKDF